MYNSMHKENIVLFTIDGKHYSKDLLDCKFYDDSGAELTMNDALSLLSELSVRVANLEQDLADHKTYVVNTLNLYTQSISALSEIVAELKVSVEEI